MIEYIIYTTKEKNEILVVATDGQQATFPWPYIGWLSFKINTFLETHSIIEPRPAEYYILNGETWMIDIDLLKAYKIDETKQVCYAHISAIVPAYADENIIDLDKKKIQAGMINLPTAGTAMDKCLQIWNFFINRKALINAETNIETLLNYDPSTDNWPY